MSNSVIRTKKIKGIISANRKFGDQVCANKINAGGFPAPGYAKKWHAEHIGPMMRDEISLKPVLKRELHIGAIIDGKTHDIIFRNSVTHSAFLRAAIAEKIEREGLK